MDKKKLICSNKGQEGGYLWEQQSGGVQRVVGASNIKLPSLGTGYTTVFTCKN